MSPLNAATQFVFVRKSTFYCKYFYWTNSILPFIAKLNDRRLSIKLKAFVLSSGKIWWCSYSAILVAVVATLLDVVVMVVVEVVITVVMVLAVVMVDLWSSAYLVRSILTSNWVSLFSVSSSWACQVQKLDKVALALAEMSMSMPCGTFKIKPPLKTTHSTVQNCKMRIMHYLSITDQFQICMSVRTKKTNKH